jgi:membrane fusion protein, multidrug efflux system
MTTQSSETGAEHGEGLAFDPTPFRPGRRGLGWSVVAAAAVLAGLVVVGVVPRWMHTSAMAAEERASNAEPARVTVLHAERSLETSSLVLPGSVQPLQETSVYARANGYVRRWMVDIGAHVEKGQVLAELEVPDIDEELRQAQAGANQTRAGIAQSKTQLELARANNRRYGALGPSGVVSQQEVDQYQAAYDVQQSNVVAAEAAHGSSLANVLLEEGRNRKGPRRQDGHRDGGGRGGRAGRGAERSPHRRHARPRGSCRASPGTARPRAPS